MFFNIKIDKPLSSYLSEVGIRLDELFVIICHSTDKEELLKSYLNSKSGDQKTAFMQSLERKGLVRRLTPELEDFDWDNYDLTEKATEVYTDIEPNISLVEIASLLSTSEDDIEEFVAIFLDKFPAGIRNKGGEVVKAHPTDVKKKMKTFLKKYKYDKETILEATDRYLTRMKTDGYGWCNSAHYFISKDNISKLAAECELVMNQGNINLDWTERLM